MSSKPHNSRVTWLAIKMDQAITWRIPHYILAYYIADVRERKKRIRKINRFCFSWWLGRFMRATVYKRRPCNRRLRFIGTECRCDNFRYGQVYRATSYNGGTYTIYGYRDYIGCAHFERL